ncbi:MAG: substrate-binding domain-containing protein, partial [Oscillospiraceae bacterium]|nr:substrate-binding domain-containing protein [Oscillospiraceae bacterium]
MRRRIAFLTMSTDTYFIRDLIRTMGTEAAKYGYDLIVLTHFVNYTDENPYITGEENIYSLLKQMHADGAIIAGATYYHAGFLPVLEKLLYSLKIPVIALEYESELFPSCVQKSTDHFRMLTEHFITEHGFTDIACLTGPKGDPHAEQRLDGFRQALAEHGLSCSEERIFYGDFWIDSGRKLAEQIISGAVSRPQAVVCGNDYMALELCLTLMKAGISIPEDIAVGGYDGNPDIAHYHPSLTTVSHSYLQNGAETVCRLHEMISGKKTEAAVILPELKTGESCGCRTMFSEKAVLTSQNFEESQKSLIFMHCSYSSLMSSVRTLEECSWTVYGSMYLLEPDNGFQIFLCTDWQGEQDSHDKYRTEGYSKKLIRILSRSDDGSADVTLSETDPDSIPESREPSVFFLTPLHYQDRCFGICVRRFEPEHAALERYYGEFCQIAANTLERLRMLEYEKNMREQIERLSDRDILTGLYSRTGFIKLIADLPASEYFAVMLEPGNITEFDRKTQNTIAVMIAQAVNLSCIRKEISARISSSRFIILGECDGSEKPEQLVIHSIILSISELEKKYGLSVSRTLQRISVTGDSPEAMLAELEELLATRHDNETHNPYHAVLHTVHDQMYESPQKKWDASEQAQKAGISISHFQHLYQECNRVSFHADLIAARTALAGQLLRSTTLSISDIAYRCGYSDSSYFTKA